MQEWPLIGRAKELRAVAEALSGGGFVGVALTGPPGVGKTRLAREAAAAATARGWIVRTVTGTVASQSIPLGAFAQWADGLDGHPLQLVASVIAAVTASTDGAPVLVCVDDAQRLDDLSAFVVHQLVLRGAARILATIRTSEPTQDVMTALWKEGHLRRLDIAPLSRRENDDLLVQVLGGHVATDALVRTWNLTQGNVFFLREIVNHGLETGRLIHRDARWMWVGPMPISAALVDLVNLHLGSVAQSILDVVDLVALAEPLELAHLVALADADAIEECERRGLIAVSEQFPADVVRLGHPLFGEVRRDTAGRFRLARIRGRIARALIAGNSQIGAPDPVRLAQLWLGSDLPPDSQVFELAAYSALQRLDLASASELAQAAVLAGAGVQTKILLAETNSLMSRGEDADKLLESMMAQQLPIDSWSMVVLLRAANLLWTLGRPEDSASVIDAALVASSSRSAPSLTAFKAVQLAVSAQPAAALDCARYLDRSNLEPLPAMMRAWALTIAYGDLGRSRQAVAAAEEGAALAATHPEAAFQGVGLAIFHVNALIIDGYPAAANAFAQHTDARWKDVPGIARTNVMAINGVAALANGDIRAAADLLRAALNEFDDNGSTVGTSYYFGPAYVQALALTGDGARAQLALDRVRAQRHRSFVLVEPDLLIAAAWVASASGQLSQARTLAGDAADFARDHGQLAREVVCLQSAIQFGDTKCANRIAALAQRVEDPRALLVARWVAAVVAHDGGALSSLSVDFEVLGDRIAAADAAAHAALAHYWHHRRGAALTAASRAAGIISECAASTPATRAAAAPLPLSERELEIALLTSKDMSNKAIALSLAISVRTVEGHVYQACQKLDVGNRIELARLFATFRPESDLPES